MRNGIDQYWSWLGVCVPVLALSAAPAVAAPLLYRLDLPAEDLTDALDRFGVATRMPVLFDSTLTDGKRSHTVRGSFTREQAVERLLTGTGLTFRFTPQGALLILAAPAPLAPPGAAAGPTAVADTAPPVSVVIVGLKQKLTSSMVRKRSADHIVDTVAADDIGKFPDANLAESLQRVSGVSISRSHGEGYQVTVRGFGPEFNTVLMDGNLMPSRNAGREFNFDDLSPDFISAVDVYKTTPLDLPSGGIGATIDIRTPMPFDYPGDRRALTMATTVETDGRGVAEPVVGAMISKRLLGNRLGILASFSRQAFFSHENSVTISAWKRDTVFAPGVVDDSLNTSGHVYSPQSWSAGMQDVRRTRVNGRLVVQYQPTDDLDVSAHIQYSDLLDRIKGASVGVWLTTSDPTTANVRTNANGTVTNYYQLNALDIDSADDTTRTTNLSKGVDVSWRARPDLSFTLSASTARSERNPNGETEQDEADVGFANQTQFVLGEGQHALPYILRYDERLPWRLQNGGPPGNGDSYLDPSILRPHILPRIADNTRDTIDQLRLRSEWTQRSWRIRAGVDMMDRSKGLRQISNVGNWCVYCGYPASPDLPDSLFTHRIDVPRSFIGGFANSQFLPPQVIAYDVDALARVLEAASGASLAAVDSGFSFKVREKTAAAFVEFRYKGALLGHAVTATGGVRYDTTRILSRGMERPLTALTYGDLTMENAVFGDPVMKQASNRFAYWLPALDLRANLSDRIVARLGLSRTLTQPPIASLYPIRNITLTRPGNFAASVGNPNLRPYISDNLDLSVEWYYSPSSFLSLNVFHKRVNDFIYTRAFASPINGILDPSTGSDFTKPDPGDTLASFIVSTPDNGGRATVTGEELAFQHLFGDSGFGVTGNLTLVDTDRPFDVHKVDQTMAVTGLSNSANLVVYYEQKRLQARLAVNWRDGYLSQIGQTQDAYEPTFVDAHTQLDASFSYKLTAAAEIYGYATNLTAAPQSTHGRFKEQFLSAVSGETRVTTGIRLHF